MYDTSALAEPSEQDSCGLDFPTDAAAELNAIADAQLSAAIEWIERHGNDA